VLQKENKAAHHLYSKLGYVSDECDRETYSTKCLDDTITAFCNEHLSEKLLKSPEIILGGALHRSWKVVTASNSYAIKELNPKIARKLGIIKSYELTEHIANEFHLKGLPAIAALNVFSYNEGIYIIYPFASGKTLSFTEIDVCHAKIIGSLFKDLHALNPQIKLDDPLPHFDLFSNDHWTAIIKNSGETKLLGLLPTILEWNNSYHASILELNKNILISHRDLHYHNVLWNNLIPSIIDWESAGLTNPIQESIGFALEWSGILHATFRKEIFDAILISYAPQGFAKNTPIQEAFYGWLGNSILGWTEFNIRRAYDKTFSTAEQSRGLAILKETMIPCLAFIKEQSINEILFNKDYAKI
jgi:thiamine kinase-like enzyme